MTIQLIPVFIQLDGFIARNFKNQKSVLGTVLDPFADKILMSVLTISLTVVSLLPGKLFRLENKKLIKFIES